MAFDRTDPADLLSLKTEVTTDPITMGYDANGSTQQILKLLNDADENVGGETAARVFDASAMMDALDPGDFESQQTTAGALDYVNALIAIYEQTGDITGYKTKFSALWAGNSATLAALNAQTSALSRAAVLYGAGTVIDRYDWLAARDS